MLSRLLVRFFLAAAFLVATQAALQHPLDHLFKTSTPAQEHCEACVAFASVGAAADLPATLHIEVSADGFTAVARAPAFAAAFTPLFRSHAPPVSLT